MPRYTELVINVAPKNDAPRWYGRDARALLAFLVNEEKSQTGVQSIPVEFFHYREHLDGATIDGLSPVRFASSKSAIRIIGLGDDGDALVMNSADAIARLFAKHFSGPMPIEVRRGSMDIERTNAPRRYLAKTVALTVHPKHYKKYKEADDITRQQMVAKHILGGPGTKGSIERMCDMLGVPMPGGLELVITGVSNDTPELIKEKNGVKAWAMILREVTFLLNADLTGPWSIGLLQSRGHGPVFRDRSVSSEKIDPRIIAYAA